MAQILLDTHYFLWLMTDLSQLTDREYDIVTTKDNILCLSVASWWEISIKNHQGKITADYIIDNAEKLVIEAGIIELPIMRGDVIAAGHLAWEHKDPFDRLIVAQAINKNLALLTRDKKISTTFPKISHNLL